MYEEDLVEDLVQQVENQQSIVDDARSAGPDAAFSASLYQMEIDRLRYSLSKYLRTRLRKVERDALYLIDEEAGAEARGRLSDSRERRHVEGYVSLLEGHFNTTCLGQMPKAICSLSNTTDEKIVGGPDLDTFVVCQARQDIGRVQVGEAVGDMEMSVDLRLGDMYIVRYRPIRDLVLDGRVELI
ncbi:unnamed protein product [Discosporangium mesarthrocarpum]